MNRCNLSTLLGLGKIKSTSPSLSSPTIIIYLLHIRFELHIFFSKIFSLYFFKVGLNSYTNIFPSALPIASKMNIASRTEGVLTSRHNNPCNLQVRHKVVPMLHRVAALAAEEHKIRTIFWH